MTLRDTPRDHSRLASMLALAVSVAALALALRARPNGVGMQPSLGAATSPNRVMVFMRTRDCDGSLEVLEALADPRLKTMYRVSDVLIIGKQAPTEEQFNRIRQALPGARAASAAASEVRALKTMGLLRTPVLIVVGSNGQIRYTSLFPRTSSEAALLLNQLRAIAYGT